jgi:hypothetical protein
MLFPVSRARTRALQCRLLRARPLAPAGTDWALDPAGLIRRFRSGLTVGWMDLGQALTSPDGRHQFVRAITRGGRLLWLVREAPSDRYRPADMRHPLDFIEKAEAAWRAAAARRLQS